MENIQMFQIYPNVPRPLSFMETLLRNLWWCWHLDAIELFRRVNPRLWAEAKRNPIIFSTLLDQSRLEELARDDSFLAHQEEIRLLFETDVESPIDPAKTPFAEDEKIAYFSMEFGIHESLPFFAGGLGILAGDHLKAASDVAVPLVGIGLLYRRGYFHQYLDPEGWQQEEYPETDLFHLPVMRARDTDGKYLVITVPSPFGQIKAAVWKLKVGRTTLYMLDTNLQENTPEVREITSRLYAGEQRIRLAQELLIGIGGMRALKALGIKPRVCHLNEGHCTFAVLERLVQIIEKHKIDFKSAAQIVARSTVFTTHTPVAAGHDEFPVDLVKSCLKEYEAKINVTLDQIIEWGQTPGQDPLRPFSMFALGMNFAQYCNGVSELHGQVARRMWAHLWPGKPVDEIPISHITNGVHIPSWISIENHFLFQRYLGPDWHLNTQDSETVQKIDDIYEEELWRSHEMSRARLIRHCRIQMVKQYARRNAPRFAMKEAETVLDQDVLTIAFARRFATYKRANLLLQDPERLEAMITSKDRPVQFVFAGKAHPKDHGGKELIKSIIAFARNPKCRHRVVFIEDYDINIARHLVQGADVWLNNPRRPYEACGTSGMKAAVNGVLNVSIMDGWWCEGYRNNRGWRIGNGEDYTDHNYQDMVESQALYNVLENEVIPSFYDRSHGGTPIAWVKKMKESMKMIMSDFCSIRMINDYRDRFYHPISEQYHSLIQSESEKAKNLSVQKDRLISLWKNIKIEPPIRKFEGPFRVGDKLDVEAIVNLGELDPKEVEVQLYYGLVKSVDTLVKSKWDNMRVSQELGNGKYLYTCDLDCGLPGRFGYTIRVVPSGDSWIRNIPGLITWA